MNENPIRQSGRAIALAIAALAVFTVRSAQSADTQWNGAGGEWSGATNWSTGKAPEAQDQIKFTIDKRAAITLDADASAAGITFATAGGAAVSIGGAHKLTLADGGSIGKAATTEPSNQTVAVPIDLAGAATFSNDNKWVHMANQLILAGPISGSGALTVTGSGDGGVALSADNSATFHGPITVSSGMLFVTQSGSLGDTVQGTHLAGGELFFQGGANTAEPFDIGGESEWESMGANHQSGPITVESGAIWKIGNGGGNALLLAGVISGPADAKIDMTCGNTTLGGTDANTFAGTIIHESDSGTDEYNELRLAKPAGVAAIAGPIELKHKAVLLWKADNQIIDSTAIILGGGVLMPAGHRDQLGVLTLTGRSKIDLDGGGQLDFADSSTSTWAEKSQLLISHWTGQNQRVAIGKSALAVSVNQLAMIGFSDPAGKPKGLYRASIQSDGTLHPGNSAVVPVNAAYDLSDSARAARTKLFNVDGLHMLTAKGSPLKKGASISFFGDSITWLNVWATRIEKAVNEGNATKELGITFHNHGVNGGGAGQIRDGAPDGAFNSKDNNGPQAKFVDVIAADKTTIAVLFIGINDVWWRNTAPDDFRQQLNDIAATAKNQGVKLVVATMAMHGELPDGKNKDDAKIEQYVQITRDIAAKAGLPLVDLRKAFVAYNQNFNGELQLDGSIVSRPSGVLTYDGIHPTDKGNEVLAEMIAKGIYEAAKGR